MFLLLSFVVGIVTVFGFFLWDLGNRRTSKDIVVSSAVFETKKVYAVVPICWSDGTVACYPEIGERLVWTITDDQGKVYPDLLSTFGEQIVENDVLSVSWIRGYESFFGYHVTKIRGH